MVMPMIMHVTAGTAIELIESAHHADVFLETVLDHCGSAVDGGGIGVGRQSEHAIELVDENARR